MTWLNHESHSAWQVQYFVMLEGNHSLAPRIVNNVSYVMRINHESHHGSIGVVLCSTEWYWSSTV